MAVPVLWPQLPLFLLGNSMSDLSCAFIMVFADKDVQTLSFILIREKKYGELLSFVCNFTDLLAETESRFVPVISGLYDKHRGNSTRKITILRSCLA